MTEKKLFFRGQREGRPRLKAPRQGHGPYHFRAACDEQDGYLPLQRSKATAYAGSLPPIYADLILNGDPEEYLKNVAGSHGLED